MAAARSPQEVFGRHAQALDAADLEQIVADYGDDAIFITRQASNAARTASTPSSFRDGLIRVQAVRYALQAGR